MINSINSDLGRVGEVDPNSNTYSSEEIIANGDNRKVAIGKLDAQAKENLDVSIAQGLILVDHEDRISVNETNISTNTSDIGAINSSLGQPNGIATLDGSGTVPAIQLPSYVDDVLEFADLASFPVTGETGKIYVALDTGKTYRWSGSIYVEISPSDVNSVAGKTGIVTLDSNDVGLSNVTDDSQLKRAAGDINTFTEKATPVTSDIVIIEDSEDSFSKKKVLLANMLGSGSGGINHITNPDFESNVDDWTGDTNIVLSQETTAPLRGDGSLKIDKSAIDASTQTFYTDFSVPLADLASIQTISYDYDFSDANYNDGDLKLQIIQDPLGAPVTISLNGDELQGGKSTNYLRFQTDHTVQDYRLQFVWESTTTDAVSLLIDNVIVAPQVIQQGAIVTDEEIVPTASITGSGSGTLNIGTGDGALYEVRANQVGQFTEINYTVKVGSSGASDVVGTYIIPLPDGVSFSSDLKQYDVLGYGIVTNKNTANPVARVTANKFGNNVILTRNDSTLISGGDSIIFNTNNRLSLNLRVKTQGLSAQANISSSFGNREIATKVSLSGNQTIPNASSTVVNLNNVIHDLTAARNGSRIDIQEKGIYSLNGSVAFDILGDGAVKQVAIRKNGTTSIVQSQSNQSGGIYQSDQTCSDVVPLERGDYIELIVFHASGVSEVILGSSTRTFLSVAKYGSPQTQLESETVAARYTSDSGQGITSTLQPYICEDRDYDTHNFYNPLTGIAKPPQSGFYAVNAAFLTNGVPMNVGESTQIQVRVNGIVKASGVRMNTVSSGTNVNRETSVSEILYIKKGEELVFLKFNTQGSSLSANPIYNYISIARVK
jgi:hypothetical protein